MLPKEEPPPTTAITETTRLLQRQLPIISCSSSSSSRNGEGEGEGEANHRQEWRHASPTHPWRNTHGAVGVVLMCVAAVCLVGFPTMRQHKEPQMHGGVRIRSAGLLFEMLGGEQHQQQQNNDVTETVNTEHLTVLSFGQVADVFVPTWYDKMVSELSVFTPTVLPDQVYVARKTILQTRDLLDVFSPIYPPHTRNISNNYSTAGTIATTEDGDVWNDLRHYVAMLYRTVGEFQDLHNCHVLYSEPQMAAKRHVVLEWVTKFETFQTAHPNLRSSYLTHRHHSSAEDDVSYTHKESHLFWDNTNDMDRIPRGSDPVTPALQTLGRRQIRRARLYLHQSLALDSIIHLSDDDDDDESDNDATTTTAHETFHNLRKELRSITDEYDVLSMLLFPVSATCPWNETAAAIDVLKMARKLLGNVNDDWTARSIYIENNEYPMEQIRLKEQVENGWSTFKDWVRDDNFASVLDYLERVLSSKPVVSLNEFLRDCNEHPSNNFIIGNEAGDADSIISAISLAYIESSLSSSMGRHWNKTPIVSIPQMDLENQRPEVKLLLELAGIADPARVLLFVNSPAIASDSSSGGNVTLVDHNVMTQNTMSEKKWNVTEIVDHHKDEGQYMDTCTGNDRTIAFANGQALVASTCTLIAERLQEQWVAPYPPSVALLLLGVILLDSVNLSTQVGKVTQRDREAVANMLRNTNWDDLPEKSKTLLGMTTSSSMPNSTAFFNILQGAKYNPNFWKALSVRDALRLDYKEFQLDNTRTFGVSSVLTPMSAFVEKPQLVSDILAYMEEVHVSLLGIMYAYEDNRGRLHRQLALCGKESFSLDGVATFLLRPGQYQSSPLDLEEVTGVGLTDGSESLKMRFFIQHNVKPSRKQIGPLIQDYFLAGT